MIYTCCFTGHRQIPDAHIAPLTAQLDASLIALYSMGCRTFFAGGAMGFDTLAAERVLLFKKTHQDAVLSLILPCLDQWHGWREEDVLRAKAVIRQADRTRVLFETYGAHVMQSRNLALVDAADACIAYVSRPASGAGQTLRAAEKKGIPVVNLANRLPL